VKVWYGGGLFQKLRVKKGLRVTIRLTPTPRAHYILHVEKRGDWAGREGLEATKTTLFCRVRFGSHDMYGGQPGGGPESNVIEFLAGESVDYVRGWGDYDDTNRWLTPRAERTPPDPAGAIHWDRQLMFLKGKAAAGPNYFVFRDTFTGNTEQNKYWHLRSFVPAESFRSNTTGFDVATPQGTTLNATFLAPARVETSVVSGRDSDKICTVAQVPVGPEQNEYLVVLYPRLADEKVPAYRTLAPASWRSRRARGRTTSSSAARTPSSSSSRASRSAAGRGPCAYARARSSSCWPRPTATARSATRA
jgi:hypothetical protein